MAGLLDFFGKGWDDPKSNAVMALAGGLLDGDFAGGVKGYAGAMAGAGDVKMNRAVKEAQLAKYIADTEIDRQKLTIDQAKAKRSGDMESMFMQMFKGGDTGMPVTADMPVTGSQPMSGGQASGRDPFAGVDRTALMLDYMQNGGKKMGDWVNDRTAPKWENINGNMVNTNAPNFSGGFQAGMKASDNGQMSMWQPDGQGGLVVGAPKGALDTYRAYRNEDEAAKARTTTTDWTPPGGQPVRMTKAQELSLLNGVQPPQSAPMGRTPMGGGSEASIINRGMSGAMGADPMALAREINATKQSLQSVPDQKSKDMLYGHLQDLERQAVNLQKQPSLAPNQPQQQAPSFGLPLQSQQEKDRFSSENKAYETKLVEQAKADTQPTQAKQANISAAENAISLVDKALAHPGLGVATGLSGAIDPRNFVPGQVGKDYKAVQSQLEGKAFLSAFEQLKGGGAISEKEGEKAQQAIARMSLSQSEKEYRQGLKDYKDVIQTGLNRMQGKESKKESKSLQDYGYKSNSDVIRDAQNTIMRNPQSKAEVERRLQAMGLSLGGK